MISTRGRYALRVMLELAKGDPDQWISLDSIAQTQHMSKKYLESIIRSLAADGYVQGLRGKGGGYRLLRKPEDIRLSEILRSAEEVWNR
ncbi:Rrf2 family transcriptional regulator [Allobaculum sp. Allo2]|uniref:RrF2 family transcriptional regulator n=1 Tax=Allobaculum sp. Allo2 TaxID=2853432 RepID=UPI001F60477B|nr:Rrf2 family transcriptional regulator [Allobaculum sp. Allo2]